MCSSSRPPGHGMLLRESSYVPTRVRLQILLAGRLPAQLQDGLFCRARSALKSRKRIVSLA